MRKCVTDIWAGVAFIVLALVFGVQLGDLTGVSRVFPQSLIILVGVGGLYFIIKGGVGLLRERCATETGDVIIWRRIGLMSMLAMGYALVIKELGFFASTSLFLFLAFMLLGDAKGSLGRRVGIGILFAGIFCLCIWVGFVKLLNVPTPMGILP